MTQPYTIRTFRTGDMGLVCSRQAILYDEGYGWGRPMEALLGEITSGFLRNFKEGREQCWIAEVDGVMAGSIFVTDGGDNVAKLRLLYVEPFARGLGVGGGLVSHVVAFAREAGYDRLQLWTHSILTSARRLYAAAGMEIVKTEMHSEFGEPIQGETWEMTL